jgi:hypothetical protein
LNLFKTIYIILSLEGLAVHWWTAVHVVPGAVLTVFHKSQAIIKCCHLAKYEEPG